MQFVYRAKKMSGEDAGGIKEAADRYDLAKILRQEGSTLISCEPLGKKKKVSLDWLSFGGGVPTAEKMIFSRNLSVMISAGLPIARALEVLSRQTKNRKFQKVMGALVNDVQKGTALSESMKAYPNVFSLLFIAMVKVGEESGKLSESLIIVSNQLERDHALTKKIQGAMIYPAIVVFAMMGIGVLMLIYVVPTLTSTFKELNVELPTSTKIVLGVSDFMTNHIAGFLLAVAGVFCVGGIILQSKEGKRLLDIFSLRMPLISPIVKKLNSARTARTLSSLVSSGINIIEALSITEDVLQNHKYKNVLKKAKVDVQKGVAISESFKKAEHLYPVLVGEMIAVGEETGKLSDMLLRLANFYEEEVSEATKNISTVIEPLLMLVIGAVVGFFAISMIKPMYSMMSGI